MTKTKIEWCDYVWNITTGCTRNCFYCYAKNMEKRFKQWNNFQPTFHADRLDDIEKLTKSSRIFVSSMGDLFDENITENQILDVFLKILSCPQHTFIILTKQFNRLYKLKKIHLYVHNLIIGSTITSVEDCFSNYDLRNYIDYLTEYKDFGNMKSVISFEPLIEKIKRKDIKKEFNNVDWVILGGMTGKYAKQYPLKKESVKEIVDFCKDRKTPIPLFFKGWGTATMKKSDPNYYLIDGKEYKEFPK